MNLIRPHLGRAPRVRLPGAGVLLLALAACAEGTAGTASLPATVRGPAVTLADSAVLSEPDSLGLGRISYLARRADGAVLVSDYEGGRILIFDWSGRFLGVFGGHGGGPGEFMQTSVLQLLPGDSLLAVMDGGRRYLSLLDARTGAFRRGLAMPVVEVGQTWSFRGDTAEFAVHPSGAVAGRWAWTGDRVDTLGRLPDRLVRGGLFYMMYGRPEILPADSGYLALIPTEPGLRLLDRRAQETAWVPLPRARRRGTPGDLIEIHEKHAAEGLPFQFLGSVAMGLHRLPGGEIAVLFADVDVVRPPPRPEFGNIRLFLSLLAPDLTRACVDAPIPLETDATPLPLFRGDTLYALSRVVTADNRVRSRLLAYRVSADGCEWVPTGGPRQGDGGG